MNKPLDFPLVAQQEVLPLVPPPLPREFPKVVELANQERLESDVRSYPRRFPIAIKRAQGAVVEDTLGQTYLDCLAGAGALALGHNHPEVVHAMVENLYAGLPQQTLDITTPAKDAFMQELMGFLPAGFASESCIQFCGPSGADAVEAAIKLAKQYTGRNNIVSFHGAYHGMTNGSLALMGNLGAKQRRTGLMADVHFFPFPYNLRCKFGQGGEAGEQASIRYIESVLHDQESGIVKPAAIIVEPIQGEGGVLPASVMWLRELRRITRELDILLILDEIQCGMGRSGRHLLSNTRRWCPMSSFCQRRSVAGCLCPAWSSRSASTRGTPVSTRARSAVTRLPWSLAPRPCRSFSAINWHFMHRAWAHCYKGG